MQVLFIRLIFCDQVYELSKRKTGCNYRKSSELQPVIKIQLFRGLFLYCSLRHFYTHITISKLSYICKCFVSDFSPLTQGFKYSPHLVLDCSLRHFNAHLIISVFHALCTWFVSS